MVASSDPGMFCISLSICLSVCCAIFLTRGSSYSIVMRSTKRTRYRSISCHIPFVLRPPRMVAMPPSFGPVKGPARGRQGRAVQATGLPPNIDIYYLVPTFLVSWAKCRKISNPEPAAAMLCCARHRVRLSIATKCQEHVPKAYTIKSASSGSKSACESRDTAVGLPLSPACVCPT